MTGNQQTRQPVFECILTKPLPVQSFTFSDATTSSVRLAWVAPENHKRLKAFNLSIHSNDMKVRYTKESF